MTERQFRYAKTKGLDLEKIQQGCEYIFKYLDENSFRLKNSLTKRHIRKGVIYHVG